MAEGGFTMHKWKTNNPELKRKVEETSTPLEDSMTYADQSLGTTKDVKILLTVESLAIFVIYFMRPAGSRWQEKPCQ